MRRLAGGIAQWAFGAIGGLAMAGAAFAQDLVGQPVPGAMNLQEGVTELRADAGWFHDVILLPMCIGISAFVLILLAICVVKYNKKANPTPARWSHNTALEIAWTVVPVLILMTIAIFSFNLLFKYHDMPKPDVTVKATGYQWNWGYEYPDQGISEYISNVLSEEDAKAKGVPFRLAATEPLVVPVNKTVRVLTTGADVIHAFGVPAFGIVIDAIPGRVNETWFKAEKTGIYYGQCRELCGVDHAFMPIEVHVVSDAEFDAWTVSKGGRTAAMRAAEEAQAAAAAQAEAAAKAAADAAVPAVAAGTKSDIEGIAAGANAPPAANAPNPPAAAVTRPQGNQPASPQGAAAKTNAAPAPAPAAK